MGQYGAIIGFAHHQLTTRLSIYMILGPPSGDLLETFELQRGDGRPDLGVS